MLSEGKGIRWITAGILLTLVAIVGRELLPERTEDLLTPARHVYFISADTEGPHAGMVQWVDEPHFRFRCRYAVQDPSGYQPCSLTFMLTRAEDITKGMDLRRYQQLQLELAYEGKAPFVRVGIRNFDPRFARKEDGNSSRIQTINLRTRDIAGPLSIGLSELTVPEWWIAQYNLAREFNIPSLDNATSVTIDLPSRMAGEPHELQLKRLVLQGEWISREALYLGILSAWMLCALGMVGRRLVQLREQQHRQEYEIEALVARTAHLHAEQRTLRRMAAVDELTGVLNRRGIEQSIADAGAPPRDVALIVVDIDHFKRINDTHGHDAGDQVLQRIAAIMARNVRTNDVLGRWGGEEFLVACMNCAPEHAVKVAEKIRQRIESSSFDARLRIAVTASLGVAMIRDGESFAETFKRADAALYRAKSGGRNRVVFDDEPPDGVQARQA